MEIIAKILTALVAIEHLYIMWFEMFAWTTVGAKVFRGLLPEHLFQPTKGLAANQGLYNGFLAAGLIWSFCVGDTLWSLNIRYFFLACVIIAALYGAVRSSRMILLKQGLPAILALIFTYLQSVCS